jgi:hypothetical protein
MPPLQILMVTQRFFPEMGGIETHVYETSRRLVNQGCRVRVLTTDRSGQLSAQEAVGGVRVTRVAERTRLLHGARHLPQHSRQRR